MTDFLGLGGGIEKVEEYLGKKITGAFIVLVVLAVSAVSMKAIWDNLVQPIATFLQTPLWGQSLLSYLWVAATVMLGVAGGLGIATSLTRWRYIRQIKGTTRKAREVLQETRSKTDKMFAETHDVYDRAERLFVSARDDVEQIDRAKEEIVDLMALALSHARSAIAADGSLSEEEKAKKLADVERKERALKEVSEGGSIDDGEVQALD